MPQSGVRALATMREERMDDAPETTLKGVNPLDLGDEQPLDQLRYTRRSGER